MSKPRNKRPDNKGSKSENNKNKRSGYSRESKDYNPRGRKGSDRVKDNACGNDVSWYTPDAQVLRDAASLNFSVPSGTPIPIGMDLTHDGGKVGFTHTNPGVLSFQLQPSIGSIFAKDNTTGDANTAINVAARTIYSYVRHANSGHSNYDAPDLMMYLMAMDNAYMVWSHLVRLYGVARNYSFLNKYTPDTVLSHLGVSNAPALGKCLAQLRQLINVMALKMSSFAVPTVMPYFRRHLWLYQNIFKDADTSRAQYYILVPHGFYSYVEMTATEPSYLKYNVMPSLNASNDLAFLNAVQNIIDTVLNPIVESETFGIMSGDILKAYGPENVFGFATIPEEYVVVPTIGTDVLHQFHNATLAPDRLGEIKQDMSGNLYQNWLHATTEHPVTLRSALLDMHQDVVEPADVMYSTRLATLRGTNYANASAIWTAGSEIVVGMKVTKAPGSLAQTLKQVYDISATTADELPYYSGLADVLLVNNAIAPFDWAPALYYFAQITDEAQNVITEASGLISETDNCINLTYDELKRIHDCALAGLFAIPYSLTRA